MGIEEMIGKQREQILALAAKRGAFNVRIFGSVARGDANWYIKDKELKEA